MNITRFFSGCISALYPDKEKGTKVLISMLPRQYKFRNPLKTNFHAVLALINMGIGYNSLCLHNISRSPNTEASANACELGLRRKVP